MRRNCLLYTLVLSTVFLLARHVLAQLPDSCGKDSMQYNVKTTRASSVLAPAPSDMAQVVFVEALDGDFFPAPTVRFAMDGNWLGATRGKSYFALNVPPGIHKLCGGRQSGAQAEKANVGVATTKMEAGKTYFYEFKLTRSAVGDLEMDAAGSMAGNRASSQLGVKERETLDSVSFIALAPTPATAELRHLPLSTCTVR